MKVRHSRWLRSNGALHMTKPTTDVVAFGKYKGKPIDVDRLAQVLRAEHHDPLLAKAAAQRALHGGVNRGLAHRVRKRYGVKVKVLLDAPPPPGTKESA